MILFTLVPDGPISRIADSGGSPAYVSDMTKREGGHRFPQFLPDGRHFLYFMAEAAKRGVYVGTLDGPDRRHLFDADTAAVFVPPAAILFVRGGRLMMQRFDAATQKLAGEPCVIAHGIVVDSTGAAAVSASETGAIVYRTGSVNRQRQLAWFDRSGQQIGDAFPPDSDSPLNPRLSPDGRFAAMTRTVGGVADIWLQDLTRRGALTKLTTSPTPDISPVWSPDGQRVASGSIGPQGFSIGVTPLSGGQPATFLDTRTQEIPTDWSRDGRFILYRRQGQDGNVDLWALPTADPQKPFPIIQTMAEERTGAFSPDGKWVAFESNESGHYEIFVQAFPTPGIKTVVSTAGGRQARWGATSGELFYVAPDARLMVVSLTPGADSRTIDAAPPQPLFGARILGVPVGGAVVEYDVTSDGKRFLMNTLVEHANTPITLILNGVNPCNETPSGQQPSHIVARMTVARPETELRRDEVCAVGGSGERRARLSACGFSSDR